MWLDGYLKENLDQAREAVKKDNDMLFIVDGLEGSGKSAFAQQVAGYLDPTLSLDRITFTPDEFVQAVKNAGKYQAVVYDEAMSGLASRSALSEINRRLVGVLAEMRQKNLFVFIVMPCFFELDKYPAIWRSRALFHIYTKHLKRGFFKFYNTKKKKLLYLKGKKFYEYKVLPDFHGKFPKGYYVDEQEYRQKKLQVLTAIGEAQNAPGKSEIKYKNRSIILIKTLIDQHNYTQKQIAEILDIDRSAVGKMINNNPEV